MVLILYLIERHSEKMVVSSAILLVFIVMILRYGVNMIVCEASNLNIKQLSLYVA